MIRLIYHDPLLARDEVSEFDRSVMSLVPGQELLIACPYLTLEYLERIIERSGKGWRLLTDAVELIRSQTLDGRRRFTSFIANNLQAIRHLPRLHAKAIITGDSALIGSANFTISGITRQTELSVLLSGRNEVTQLRDWFDTLWEGSAQIDPIELDALITSLPAADATRPELQTLTAPQTIVRTKLLPFTTRRAGRWTEAAFLGRVAEKYPMLLDAQINLIEELKRNGFAEFRGDGPKQATYHAVVPETKEDVLWIWEDGGVYVNWAPLEGYGIDFVRDYIHLWEGLVSPTNNYGSNLAKKLNTESASTIVANLSRLSEMIQRQ